MQFLTQITNVELDALLRPSLIFFSTILILFIFKNFIVAKLKKRAELSKSKIDDSFAEILGQIKPPLILIIAFFVSINTLEIPENVHKALDIIFKGAVILQIILLTQSFVNLLANLYIDSHKDKIRELKTIYEYGAKTIAFLIWTIGILFFLSNIGLDISSIIAGLGIGGLAVALAVQNVLKEILSTVTLLVTKPFEVGDHIKLSEKEQGTVKKIGFRNTIIKTVDSEELIVSNDDILSSRIINYRNRTKRRVSFNLSINLSTPSKKLEVVKQKALEIINSEELIQKDKSRVLISEFTPNAIIVSIVYHMINDDFSDFSETKDRINLKLKDMLEVEGVELAKVGMAQP